MALSIVAAYVAVWLFYGWRLTIAFTDKAVTERIVSYPSLYSIKDAKKLADDERLEMIIAGFFVAVWWPVTLPVRSVYLAVSGRGLFTTPIEKESATQRELEALRRLARENNLPMPEETGR